MLNYEEVSDYLYGLYNLSETLTGLSGVSNANLTI